ncbi:MAG: hypothetical protein V3R98_07275 [Alphaproteobacteria bacterium]
MTASVQGLAGDRSRGDVHSQEYALLDHAQRIERRLAGRLAVHIHLSSLQSHNRREHHIRVALTHFEELVKPLEGQIFQLMNNDIVFSCKGAKIENVDEAVLKLRYLFSEDPLTRYSDDQTDGGFCTWYVMEHDYPKFLEKARRFQEMSDAHRQESRRLNQVTKRNGPQYERPLTPDQLGKLVDALENADLSALVRNQAICAIAADEPPQAIFHEMYVSIGDLEQTLLPGVSITADPWLFRYLTLTLDKRMLAQMLRDHANSDRAFSLNLNVATVLSPEFQRFDQGIGLGVRGRLVVELQKVDIFADMGAYRFAREYLRERGYRVCLDGLTYLTLPFVDRERLGIDLMKMYWSDELLSGLKPDSLDDLEAHIRTAGIARVIMCHCESREAYELGSRLGISLFQGRYIDHLLDLERPLTQRQGSIRFK